MQNQIIKEYKILLEQKWKLESALITLPLGYISQKNIKGKSYSYLQQRVSSKLISRYLKKDEIAETIKRLAQRNKYDSVLPQIVARMGELEQAAHLVDKDISRSLLRLKVSSGLDGLYLEQKKDSFAFASAMNAIEGISITSESTQNIARWQDGSRTFFSVFERTLKRYGFSTAGDDA